MKNRKIPTVKPASAGYARAVVRDDRYKAKGKRIAQRNRERATPTYDEAWRRLRLRVLKRDVWCPCCLAEGRRVFSVDVDHIDGNSGNNAMSNLQGLCKSCHAKKTRREQLRAPAPADPSAVDLAEAEAAEALDA